MTLISAGYLDDTEFRMYREHTEQGEIIRLETRSGQDAEWRVAPEKFQNLAGAFSFLERMAQV